MTLLATDLPPSAFGFFLVSPRQDQLNNIGGSFGNLCISGSIGRYVGPGQIRGSGPSGRISLQIDLTQTPSPIGPIAIAPGETWNFQLWHRDTMGGQIGSNFTRGSSITFQ